MIRSVEYGSKTIRYRLDYTDRKTLGITVTPEMEILVRAPQGASLARIDALVLRRAPWILRQLSFFLAFEPKSPPRKYIGGETHLYLGRQYRLRIQKKGPEKVKMNGGFIDVWTSARNRVKPLIDEWYLYHAHTRIALIAAPLVARFEKYNAHPAEIVLREMPARWGSCTRSGRIVLNPELIKAPRGCIEYVIIHELCHLVHHNHSPKFLDLQSKEMPDWLKWKNLLEKSLQ